MSIKLTTHIPHEPTILLLGIYPREMKPCIFIVTSTQLFIAVPLMKKKKKKKLNQSPTVSFVLKLFKTTMAFYSHCVKAIHTKGVSQEPAEALIVLASITGCTSETSWVSLHISDASDSRLVQIHVELSCSLVESLQHCFHFVFLGLRFLGIYLI